MNLTLAPDYHALLWAKTTTLLRIELHALAGDEWHALESRDRQNWKGRSVQARLILTEDHGGSLRYHVSYIAGQATHLRLALRWPGVKNCFHLIPSCIHGDNNAALVSADAFPLLCEKRPGAIFASPEWEFRADRASLPFSALACDAGVAAISISPYSNNDEGREICRGLFAKLPDACGVSLGYRNFPVTFVSKGNAQAPTSHPSSTGEARGHIFLLPGEERTGLHRIVRALYDELREESSHENDLATAAAALVEGFVTQSWSDDLQHYSNKLCRGPYAPALTANRPLVEIGWTGGTAVAWPLLQAQETLRLPDDIFAGRLAPEAIFDRVAASRNRQSGYFNDLTAPWKRWPDSLVNGWWAGYLVKDCHCAYTNGQAAYYLLKASLTERGRTSWMISALAVLNTAIRHQRADGAFGYTFSTETGEVLDWDGFAGCWFTAALALAAQATGEQHYHDAARRSFEYYKTFLSGLNCWGTPMDTWKAADQEGNLAFIRAARILHEMSGEEDDLSALTLGAEYEYLWRYGYRAHPPCPPLNTANWNSCGGSITSVSNPHIHPMGVSITGELDYLSNHTGDTYHRKRADDGVSWMLQTMELYPAIAGYGTYGILSERFCPSDGLLTETYADGTPSSIWFTLNAWAMGSALEGFSSRLSARSQPLLIA